MTIVETERLAIRRFRADDTDALHRYRNDADIARWQGWSIPVPYDDARQMAEEMAIVELFTPGRWTQLALERRNRSGLIGDLGIRIEADEPAAELGFTIAREHWGNRYGAEALTAITTYLFDTRGLVRVVAFTDQQNTHAQRALEAAGLRAVAVDGDDFVYTRLAGESPGAGTGL